MTNVAEAGTGAAPRAPIAAVAASRNAEASRSDRRIERAAGGPTEATKVPCEQQLLFTEPSPALRSSATLREGQSRSTNDMAVTTDLLPPRYRDPVRIGRGGMGDIYRATDSMLGREAAIKILADRYAQDTAIRERFTREALAAARLSGEHHTVTIYDVGDHNGRPYIVMEYLSG